MLLVVASPFSSDHHYIVSLTQVLERIGHLETARPIPFNHLAQIESQLRLSMLLKLMLLPLVLVVSDHVVEELLGTAKTCILLLITTLMVGGTVT